MRSFTLRVFLLVLLLAGTPSRADQLPDLGNSSYGSLSSSEEKKLGALFMQQVRHSVPLVKDPILTHYLNTLGRKLVSQSSAHDKEFDFFLVDSGDINAFAGPASHVGVNAGTVLLAKEEDEIASVLAHEITHVSQHHLARAMEKARGSTLTALATIAAALIVGATTHQGDAAMAGVMAAQTLSMENQLGYSRDNEREADRIGINVLHKSQYDPQAMPRFLTRMSQQQVDLLGGRFSYLRTHPINEERIADAKARADQFPVGSNHKEKLHFQLMQMRLLALSGEYNPTKLQHFSQRNRGNNTVDPLAQRYAHGLLLQRGAKWGEAEKVMSALHQEKPDNLLFSMALADIFIAKHKLDAAQALLEKSLRTNPDYPPLLLSYAEVLLQQNKAELALKLLDSYVKDHRSVSLELLEQLAKAQAKNGYMSRAYLTRARMYYMTDEPKLAQLQIQQAMKYASAGEKAFIKHEMDIE